LVLSIVFHIVTLKIIYMLHILYFNNLISTRK
jgi:hypothetical protein